MRWLNPPEEEVWRRLLTVECKIHEKLDRDLREQHGLSLGDYEVLVHLSEAEGQSVRMSELADKLRLSRSGLTRRVDGLVGQGMVRRRTCPEDRRGALAELTAEGRCRLAWAAPTHVAGVLRYVLEPLGDLDALAAGIRRLEKALDATNPIGGPGRPS